MVAALEVDIAELFEAFVYYGFQAVCSSDWRNGSEVLERAAAGRKAAKARGVRFGAKPKLTPFRRSEALKMLAEDKTCREVAEYFGVSHSTISRLARGLTNRPLTTI